MGKTEFIHAILAEKIRREKRRGRRKNLATYKEASEWYDVMIYVMEDAILGGEKLKFTNFGTFDTRVRAGYQGVHPKSGKPVWVPEQREVRFSPAQSFKDRVLGKRGDGYYGDYEEFDEELDDELEEDEEEEV